jgi:uncharacterized membrane protein
MILVVLVPCVVALIARAIGWAGVAALNSWPAATRVGLAAMFLFTAGAHFAPLRKDLARMVPPWVPWPMAMIYFTGVCEIAGAIGLLVPQLRVAAAWSLIVFLVAILPANIHAANQHLTIRGEEVPSNAVRIPLQVVFIALVWWSGVRAAGR